MSTKSWVTFRDSVIDSLKFDKVTDSMKDELVKWLLDVLLPMAKTAADDFVAQIKAQASSETGWCKIRDAIVLPFVIEGGLWLIELALNKVAPTDNA